MSRWNLAWLLGIAAVVSLGFAVSQSAPSRAKDKDYELVRLVVDVLSEVDRNYVRELDDNAKRKLVEDMINGGLEQLDPHSAFINSRRYRQFDRTNRGEFGGIGIEVLGDGRTGTLHVEGLLVGTPAYEAGMQAGDTIVKVEGKPTKTMQPGEAVDMIQGEPGQKIRLTVVHAGSKDPVDLEMVRARIHIDSVRGDVRKKESPNEWDYFMDKANKIAYVRLTNFGKNTAEELRHVLVELQHDGLRGLILDLRTNPGGLLQSAVEISNLFLTEGRIVSTRGRNAQDDVREYDAKSDGALLLPAENYPTVILVNRYSASASEIVSAALQDHHRAVIVGERTYGKGSVQNVIRMENGTSALKLTTASYWRPSGKNIHRFPDSKDTDDWGVKPNPGFEVPMKDEDLIAYLNYRRGRDMVVGKGGVPKAAKSDKPYEDRVLEKALGYLRQEIKKVQAAKPPAQPDHG
jgi:carboxyl-terminal processing protease